MGKFFLLLCLFSFNTFAAPFTLVAVSNDALSSIYKSLEKAGVLRLDPYDPRLPYPQVQALEALLNPKTGAMAYVNGESGFGFGAVVFKNRHGGNVHSMSASPDHIQFTTPYMGNVAHANRFKTVEGWNYHFYCQSVPVNKAIWDTCIQRLFINVVVGQLIGPS